jgi:hypothetical protein
MRINYLAVIVAGLANWLLGWLWYGVLFSNKWIELMGWDAQKVAQVQQQGEIKPMIYSLVGGLVTALILAYIYARAEINTWLDGLKYAGLIWLGFVALIGMDTVLFEERKYGLYQINSTYHLAGLLIAGAIIGAWRKKS